MNYSLNLKKQTTSENFLERMDILGQMIAESQYATGEIPWFRGGKTDPWDMVESIMGLSICGYYENAERGFNWLKDNQLENGSWYSSYQEGKPDDKTMDTNLSSYIAAGLYHYYLITENINFLKQMWEPLEKSIEFLVSMQADSGEIYWAKSPEGKTDRMALLTGSSSAYFSLKCALAISEILGFRKKTWITAMKDLGCAISTKPHLFNIGKSRFSMYWYYPILSGALTGETAENRIKKFWNKYMIESNGVRCVSDRPWVTMAESSELVIALSSMGDIKRAEMIFNWISDKVYEDNTYWCGYTFPDYTVWPEDKLTWTNAAVLLAADSLYNFTKAGQIFSHKYWSGFSFIN